MSRYTLLFLLNLPLILMAFIGTIAKYKLGHSTKRRTIIQLLIWICILIGLVVAEPLYEWLQRSGYTDTNSLSLFDVIQITAIIIALYICSRLQAKTDVLEQRFNSLHREVSIRLSEKE